MLQATLSPAVRSRLRCPVCANELLLQKESAVCASAPSHSFPVVEGVPVLINEEMSVFSIADFTAKHKTFFQPSRDTLLKRFARHFMPSVSVNVRARKNFKRFASLLSASKTTPRVLVIGGSIAGEGFEAMIKRGVELVETDVAWGPRVQLICDIHDLPFADRAFDGVVVQAVLEHVVDPYRGVEEIYRVLKPNGLVYAETPFIQQVHGGRYDFTRFTFLGHRRLFRRFEQIDGGAVCGPGMALAWSWQYFWWSFTTSPKLRRVILFFTSWTSFFWKYFDYALIDKPAALDAASGVYFMGRKSDSVLSDRELLALYDKMRNRRR
jgi:SAM-dependent methyltransferase